VQHLKKQISEFYMSLSNLNNKKWIRILANGFLIWIAFMIFIVFLIIDKYSRAYEISENIVNITVELNNPFIKGGMVLTCGLFCMIISKIFKSNILIIAFGILTLIVYYLKMLWIGI
tara:strand:+ start:841 stop:1191 length:351 start_codon:yes stop_codon:yes gene_type:complete